MGIRANAKFDAPDVDSQADTGAGVCALVGRRRGAGRVERTLECAAIGSVPVALWPRRAGREIKRLGGGE